MKLDTVEAHGRQSHGDDMGVSQEVDVIYLMSKCMYILTACRITGELDCGC